jgi:hypothetical protein
MLLLGPIVHLQFSPCAYSGSVPCEIVPEFADVLTMPPEQHVLAAPVDVHVGRTVGSYSPTAHEHAPLPGWLVLPMGHARHALAAPAPAEEYVFAGHAVHVATDVAPVAAEYVPFGHAKQAETELAPSTAEYVPAGQTAHAGLGLLAPYQPAAHAVQVGLPMTSNEL